MRPIRHRTVPSSRQLHAEEYCRQQKVEIDLFRNDIDDWSVWISYPNGVDRVYAKELKEEEVWPKYWAACVMAADIWYETVNYVPPVPDIPKSVPKVPKIGTDATKNVPLPPVPPLPIPLVPVPKVPPVPKNI